jgi:formylglycine-generating enzyme required for sulfatase activity
MGDHFQLMRQANCWPYEAVQQGARIFEFMNNSLLTNAALFAIREDGSRNYATFCYSAPELLACYIHNLERVWDKGGKGAFIGGITRNSVTLWPSMDLGNNSLVSACRCPACREMSARGGDALLMGDFVRRLCEQVKSRWPDKKVIYVPWGIKTCPEELSFPDNLVVNSLDLGTMGLLHQPTIRQEQEGLLRTWAGKTGRPLTMWIDFAGPGDWTFGPVQFPHLVKEFYQSNRNRLDGGLVLSYGAACFVTAAPTYYVWNRALWNPDLDVEATLDEMCKRLFGAGAASARELLRLECDRWQNTALSRPLRISEQRVPPKLFREIWPPDVVARMKTLRDQALEEIDRTGDGAARKAFLYWTWSFNAFVDYAEAINGGTAWEAVAKPSVVPAAVSKTEPVDEANTAAAARFRGGPFETNQAVIANVRLEKGAAEGQGAIQFDLAWGNTWRAAWTEPAARNVTGKDLPVESWSAVWVFAKYRIPGREKDGYFPATLSPERIRHKVPEGTSLDVGLTGAKGAGVFIYRASPGLGALNLKDVGLCWLHGADGVTNPAVADLKVFAIEMVYVPRGAFLAGSGGTEDGTFTDGSWTDGATIPFQVDANWSGPVADGSNARRIGSAPGRLWGISEFGRDTIGPAGALVTGYPTGYEPFYCMRYEVTRGQFTAFLNTMSSEAFASTSAGDSSHAGATYTAVGRYNLLGVWPNFTAAKPYQACNLLSWWDGAKFAAWAGLRPMTELEYEKACRGPRLPVTNEFAWGTSGIAQSEYTAIREGAPDERVAGNEDPTVGNANYDLTLPAYFGGPTRGGVSAIPGSPMRAGIFATPESGRVAAGASYWGIVDLSGNVREQVVTLGNAKGRLFEGSHGAGTLDIPADWPAISGSDLGIGAGYRGGFFGDLPAPLRTSDRSRAVFKDREASFSREARSEANGWRGVRTAPDAAMGIAAVSPVAIETNRLMPRLDHAFRADGVLNEWSGRPELVRRSRFQIFPEDRRRSSGRLALWQGPEDLGVKAWWGWDGEALCVAAEVADDRHINGQTGGMIWNGDALQIGLVTAADTERNLGLALTTNGAVFHQFEGKGDALSQTAAYGVVRDEAARITRYELRLPLVALGLEPGAEFGLNVAFIDDDDGRGMQYWIQMAPGLLGRGPKSLPPAKTYPRFMMAR